MWRGHDLSLYVYLLMIKAECDERGIQTENNWNAIQSIHASNRNAKVNVKAPLWLGDERVHLSHRQNLYAKDPEYYYKFERDSRLAKSHCCPKCNYFWPTERHGYTLRY